MDAIRKIFAVILKTLVGILFIPCIVLIAGGVLLLVRDDNGGWISIVTGLIMCAVVVVFYKCLNMIINKVTNKIKEASRKKETLKQEEENRKQEEIIRKREEIAELNRQVSTGEWVFPAEKLYRVCQENNVTALNNEFSIKKATQIAKQIIQITSPDIDLANCSEYLKRERLEELLKEGSIIAREADERKLLQQRQPRNADPNQLEMTFIQRTAKLPWLYGYDKRKQMLTNLVDDYDIRIREMRRGEEALRELGMIYAGQQKKETSWAVMGGIAEGIAGPTAGVMVASNAIANNREIQQYNESVRKVSMDIMSGVPGLAGERYQLEEERAKIEEQLYEVKNKVVLNKPNAEEIWQNINVGYATVKKNPSGVLSVSLPISLKQPFALDVPENTLMVVDGVIKAQVWFEGKRIDNVYFPLPLYGIPHNMTAEIILDGMCGRSVECDGEYTVKISSNQNLWIMEA